jgi:hypoxanthine phosphoribosyltransferase
MGEDEIAEAASRIGGELTERLKAEEKVPVLCCVMMGALNWMADLMKHIDCPAIVDYIQISSYAGSSSTGNIVLKRDVEADVAGRTVVIVEDIVDTGLSMSYLVRHFKEKGAKDIIVAALISKLPYRRENVKIDYVGKVLNDNKFLVGYGLDYNGLYRNRPEVFVPDPAEIKAWDETLGKTR